MFASTPEGMSGKVAGQDLADQIHRLVQEQMRQRAEAIDRACEMALANGTCGVAVYKDLAMVDPAVPYGHIYEYSCRYDERTA